MLPLFYSELYGYAIDQQARFPRSRYWRVYESLNRRVDGAHLRVAEAEPAAREDLLRMHDPDYVDAFLEGDLAPEMVRRIGFRPWTDDFIDRTLAITGGSLAAVRRVLAGEPMAGNLAGGTHHAFAARGGGYCVFNDIAIGVDIALEAGVEHIAVVDLDVHQGDGTAALLADHPQVFTLSVHCAENYPFRKQTSDLDVPVPEGSGDRRYLDALDSGLAAIKLFSPELIVFQAGVDGLEADRHGRLALTRGGLRRRNRRVFEMADALQAPVVVLMGGGYAEPIDHSVAAHVDLFEEAAGRYLEMSGRPAEPSTP